MNRKFRVLGIVLAVTTQQVFAQTPMYFDELQRLLAAGPIEGAPPILFDVDQLAKLDDAAEEAESCVSATRGISDVDLGPNSSERRSQLLKSCERLELRTHAGIASHVVLIIEARTQRVIRLSVTAPQYLVDSSGRLADEAPQEFEYVITVLAALEGFAAWNTAIEAANRIKRLEHEYTGGSRGTYVAETWVSENGWEYYTSYEPPYPGGLMIGIEDPGVSHLW